MTLPRAGAIPITTDALVVGAGPVGLFQVFQLGLLEMHAEVVDVLPEAGGQCLALYADKPIYDIPALAVCSGRELVQRLLRQIEPLAAGFHFGQQVAQLQRRDDGRFDVATSAGTAFVARTVVVAAGVGAFVPRTLALDGTDAFARHGDDADPVPGQRVLIIGGTEQALAAALRHAAGGARVTLLHRREIFDAEPATVAAMRAAAAIRFIAGQPTGVRAGAVTLLGSDGTTRDEPFDRLLVLLGLSPRLGPVAQWGLALDRKQLVVDSERLQTSEPGIYAVGDIVTYPGKKKLIVCGFHEATLAAYAAAAHAYPQRQGPLQYTTTSPRLHALLGVAPPV